MRLTAACNFFKKLKHVPGHLTKGKVRLYPYISERTKKAAMEDMLRERNNLEILAAPYLTFEEDHNHAPKKAYERFQDLMASRRAKSWYCHVVAEDCFKMVAANKKWE
ncbi:uncharacterized protein LOC115224878 [Argonauta hians]